MVSRWCWNSVDLGGDMGGRAVHDGLEKIESVMEKMLRRTIDVNIQE